jgi:hypothetical protein
MNTRHCLRRLVATGLALTLLPARATLAAGPEEDLVSAIRAEGTARSEIAATVRMLADVYGPRLTASPAAKEAAAWALARMRGWGLSGARLEPWNFGHPGWQNLRADGQLLVNGEQPLSFGVAAWTPGTGGAVTARAVVIDPPEEATDTALAAYLQSVRGRVRGRIVLIGRGRTMPFDLPPASVRDSLITELRAGRMAPSVPETPDPRLLTRRERSQRIDAFLVAAGAAVRVDAAERPFGIVGARANLTFDTAKAPPSVVLSDEDYGRIVRLVEGGRLVFLRFDIRNRLNESGRTAYNAVAEIPGTDEADEVVILGAHLDSWHLATGAVDNAAGCAIIMETARIIQRLGLHPRRTIRIVLWSGEEQYLLGSQAYVARHFGTAEAPLAEFGKVAAYINIDGGSGKVRGANIFGPDAAAAMVRGMLEPLSGLGVEGAFAHTVRRLGSTDATSFSRAGLTSIGLIQDPLDYSLAWHGTLDSVDRLDVTRAQQAATVATVLALAIANREGLPPRFSPTTMPKPIGPPPAAR